MKEEKAIIELILYRFAFSSEILPVKAFRRYVYNRRGHHRRSVVQAKEGLLTCEVSVIEPTHL
jgi:hypothetical protein